MILVLRPARRPRLRDATYLAVWLGILLVPPATAYANGFAFAWSDAWLYYLPAALLVVPLGFVRFPRGHVAGAGVILVLALVLAWVTFLDVLVVAAALVLAAVLLAWPREEVPTAEAASG